MGGGGVVGGRGGGRVPVGVEGWGRWRKDGAPDSELWTKGREKGVLS